MVDGFLIIDKPAGITSHDVVNRVRRILNTRKAGHTGTLDPFATGVLPIAVGEGTKAIPFLDEGNKEYEAVILLGTVTDTLDYTGAVLKEADWSTVTASSLQESMATLTGTISQIPPMYSAIKQGGQPLYKLARKGVEVERQPRQVTIQTFELLACDFPELTVQVRCSRGTYIRTLADDLGRLLGCGACLTSLRRTMSGPFRIDDALSLEQLEEYVEQGVLQGHFTTSLAALTHLPEIVLTHEQMVKVTYGITPELPIDLEICRISYERRLLAVAQRRQDGRMMLQRVFH